MRKKSNKTIARRMQELTSLSYREAQFACWATMRAIASLLMEGHELELYQFGNLEFRFRKGRILPPRNLGNRQAGAVVQRDQWRLKFQIAKKFKAALQDAQKNWTRK